MYLEVYIDVVFIINLVMDFIILTLVKIFMKKHTKRLRLFIGAIIGAIVMCIIVVLPYNNFLFNVIFGYLVSSMLIIYITFLPKNLAELIKLTLMMYLIAAMLGGIMVALYYYSFIGTAVSRMINGTYIEDMKIGLFILFGIIALIIFKLLIKILYRTLSVNKNLFDLEIIINTYKINVSGLLDTGNNLYDPITKKPVIIGEYELLKTLLPSSNYEKLNDIMDNLYNIKEFVDFQQTNELKLRLIPFSSLGNDNGMLLGIVTDNISINMGKIIKKKYDVVIAVYNKKLSNDNSYQVLIHPELIS